MKAIKLVYALSTLALACTISTQSQAASIPVNLKQDLINVCIALKSDDTMQLKRAIRDSRISTKELAKGLVCNGQDSFSFALSQNALETADYIAQKAYFADANNLLAAARRLNKSMATAKAE